MYIIWYIMQDLLYCMWYLWLLFFCTLYIHCRSLTAAVWTSVSTSTTTNNDANLSTKQQDNNNGSATGNDNDRGYIQSLLQVRLTDYTHTIYISIQYILFLLYIYLLHYIITISLDIYTYKHTYIFFYSGNCSSTWELHWSLYGHDPYLSVILALQY